MLLLDFWKICAPIIHPLLVCAKLGLVLVTNNDYNVVMNNGKSCSRGQV